METLSSEARTPVVWKDWAAPDEEAVLKDRRAQAILGSYQSWRDKHRETLSEVSRWLFSNEETRLSQSTIEDLRTGFSEVAQTTSGWRRVINKLAEEKEKAESRKPIEDFMSRTGYISE